MTLRISVPPARWVIEFSRDSDEPVVLGRARMADVRVGDERVQGRWAVSKVHAEVRWDGIRWTTTNMSGKPGLLHVYEPGYEGTAGAWPHVDACTSPVELLVWARWPPLPDRQPMTTRR